MRQVKNYITLEPAQRTSPYLQEDWIFAVLIGVLVALAVVKYTYPRRMLRLGQALIRVRILLQLMREEMVMSHRSAVTLFLTFAISSGLLVYLAAKIYGWPVIHVLGAWLFPLLVLLIALVYLWKIVTIRLVQLLFAASGGLSEYLNYSFVMNALLGILWLPIILVATVSLNETARWVVLLAAGIFTLTWVIRIIQGVQFALRHRVFPVYIILYLCALEILPLAVIAKGVAEVKF